MSDDCVLRLERLIHGTPEAVFDAWTKPERLVKWWGPEGFTVPEHTLDVRVGGAWRTVMRSPEGSDHIVNGVYREIDRPHRLVFTWAWEQEDGSRGHETVVTIEFTARDGGTLVQLTQATFAEKEQRDSHEKGWASSLNDLERLFAKAAV